MGRSVHYVCFTLLSLWWRPKNTRVGLIIPIHHLVCILMVFFESNELLLDQDSTSIIEMVCWHIFKILHTIPSIHSFNFVWDFIDKINESKDAQD